MGDSGRIANPAATDIIAALQTILASYSPAIIPDFETPYSRFHNTHHSRNPAIEGWDQSIAIKSVITERQQQLDAVLHDISDLATMMNKLKTFCLHLTEKRDKITQSMTLHKGLLSALWRLPNEILSKIFIHCLPETSFVPPGRSSNQAPMLLTRICQRWRDVAVDTPSLWCKLYAEVQHCELFTNIYYSPDKKWHQQAFLFDLWFKRSQGRPIELELSGDTITDSLSYGLRCLVQPYNNRISSLLVLNKISVPGLFFGYFPVLQVLTMSSINQYQGAVGECISRLPSTLRSLIFRDPYAYGFHFDELLSFGPICAQLTNVTIGVRCPSTFLDLLRLGVNLSSATIHMKQKLDPDIRLRSFTHVKIHSLSISHSAGWTPTNPVSDLFNALSLPNLRVLDAQYMGMWPHGEFKEFLTRSNCPLERLTLAGGMTTDELRAEYIALIPSLQVEILAKPEAWC